MDFELTGNYPIIIDGRETGTVDVRREGLFWCFEATSEADGDIIRLSVFGDGGEGYLGIMEPREERLRLTKKLSRSALSGFPQRITHAGKKGFRQVMTAFPGVTVTADGAAASDTAYAETASHTVPVAERYSPDADEEAKPPPLAEASADARYMEAALPEEMRPATLEMQQPTAFESTQPVVASGIQPVLPEATRFPRAQYTQTSLPEEMQPAQPEYMRPALPGEAQTALPERPQLQLAEEMRPAMAEEMRPAMTEEMRPALAEEMRPAPASSPEPELEVSQGIRPEAEPEMPADTAEESEMSQDTVSEPEPPTVQPMKVYRPNPSVANSAKPGQQPRRVPAQTRQNPAAPSIEAAAPSIETVSPPPESPLDLDALVWKLCACPASYFSSVEGKSVFGSQKNVLEAEAGGYIYLAVPTETAELDDAQRGYFSTEKIIIGQNYLICRIKDGKIV